jgi:hypothetical protein
MGTGNSMTVLYITFLLNHSLSWSLWTADILYPLFPSILRMQKILSVIVCYVDIHTDDPQ